MIITAIRGALNFGLQKGRPNENLLPVNDFKANR